ncbi:MAG: hypothetical protein HY335_05600, partial [Deinococcus sp.]|nr:hypothetical protein [Deinococcus sp.]
LADLLMLAFKLAVVAEVDLLGELQRKMAAIDTSNPLGDARAETDRFVTRQEERALAAKAAWQLRRQELQRR